MRRRTVTFDRIGSFARLRYRPALRQLGTSYIRSKPLPSVSISPRSWNSVARRSLRRRLCVQDVARGHAQRQAARVHHFQPIRVQVEVEVATLRVRPMHQRVDQQLAHHASRRKRAPAGGTAPRATRSSRGSRAPSARSHRPVPPATACRRPMTHLLTFWPGASYLIACTSGAVPRRARSRALPTINTPRCVRCLPSTNP